MNLSNISNKFLNKFSNSSQNLKYPTIWISIILFGVLFDFLLKGFPSYYISLIPTDVESFIFSRWGYLIIVSSIILYFFYTFQPFKLKMIDIIDCETSYVFNKLNQSSICVFICKMPLFSEFKEMYNFFDFYSPLTLEINYENVSFTFVLHINKEQDILKFTENCQQDLEAFFNKVKLLEGFTLKKFLYSGFLNFSLPQNQINNLSYLSIKKIVNELETKRKISHSNSNSNELFQEGNNDSVFVLKFNKLLQETLTSEKKTTIPDLILIYQNIANSEKNFKNDLKLTKETYFRMNNFGFRNFNFNVQKEENEDSNMLVAYIFHKVLTNNKLTSPNLLSSIKSEQKNDMNLENQLLESSSVSLISKNVINNESQLFKDIKTLPVSKESRTICFKLTPFCIYSCTNNEELLQSNHFVNGNVRKIPEICTKYYSNSKQLYHNFIIDSDEEDENSNTLLNEAWRQNINEKLTLISSTQIEIACFYTYTYLKNEIYLKNHKNEVIRLSKDICNGISLIIIPD